MPVWQRAELQAVSRTNALTDGRWDLAAIGLGILRLRQLMTISSGVLGRRLRNVNEPLGDRRVGDQRSEADGVTAVLGELHRIRPVPPRLTGAFVSPGLRGLRAERAPALDVADELG